MKAEEAQKSALIQRLAPAGLTPHILPLHKPLRDAGTNTPLMPPSQPSTLRAPRSEYEDGQRTASHPYNLSQGYTPFLETVDRDMKSNHLTPMRLPSTLTTEDFTRAVAVATVSALRHQGSIIGSHGGSGHKPRPVSGTEASHVAGHDEEHDEGGGHEAPSWTRAFSAGVLLGCTVLYAIIAGTSLDFRLIFGADQDCRDPGRRRRCCLGRKRDRREIPWSELVRSCTQHDRIYERHVVRSQREHRAQVCSRPQLHFRKSSLISHRIVWRSVQRTRCKFACCRSLRW